MKKTDSPEKFSGQGVLEEAGLPKMRPLYRVAGVAVIGMLALIAVQIAAFIVWPVPEDVAGWFALLQSNAIAGLIHLDVIYAMNNIIIAVMFFGLYMSLRKKNEALTLIALLLGLMGVASYLSSNPAFEMLNLSGQYAQSASDSARGMVLASGGAALARWEGTSFLAYYMLNALSLIITGGVMLKSSIYGKTAAVLCIASGILTLVPSTAGEIGQYFSLASLAPWLIFSAMAGVKFLKLSRINGGEMQALQAAAQ